MKNHQQRWQSNHPRSQTNHCVSGVKALHGFKKSTYIKYRQQQREENEIHIQAQHSELAMNILGYRYSIYVCLSVSLCYYHLHTFNVIQYKLQIESFAFVLLNWHTLIILFKLFITTNTIIMCVCVHTRACVGQVRGNFQTLILSFQCGF